MSDEVAMADTIELDSVRRLDVKPGETLVFTIAEHVVVSSSSADELISEIQQRLPKGVEVLILANGIELTGVVANDVIAEARANT